MPRRVEMIGQRFGRLVVIDDADTIVLTSGHRITCVLVRCDCGTEQVVRSYRLRRKHKMQSCGCLHVENDLLGRRFGRLIIRTEMERYRFPSGRPARQFQLRCDCGTELTARGQDLFSGHIVSCGCWQRDHPSRLRHGDARQGQKAAEYHIWRAMIQRCTDASRPGFKDYGGRGIRVCERWLNSYEAFLADVGRRPSAKHSIDRRDNDGNYEPGNVRWATRLEQNRNRRPPWSSQSPKPPRKGDTHYGTRQP